MNNLSTLNKSAFNHEQVVAKMYGGWKPHSYLTDIAMASFQSDDRFVAKKVFPVVPVFEPAGFYNVWPFEDLVRDNVHKKPDQGHVQPALLSRSEDTYSVSIDQILVPISRFSSTSYTRALLADNLHPGEQRMKMVAQQINIHLDRIWAAKFFRSGVWNLDMSGSPSPSSPNQFLHWSSPDSDPMALIDSLITKVDTISAFTPNTLVLGVHAFSALKKHPSILERIVAGGSTANPAAVTMDALAQLLGLDRVHVVRSVWNSAPLGHSNTEYIINPFDALLVYSNPAPSIDDPSAGYIFAWDMLGDGRWLPVDFFEGDRRDHVDWVEGMIAVDMKATAPSLGVFLSSAAAPDEP